MITLARVASVELGWGAAERDSAINPHLCRHIPIGSPKPYISEAHDPIRPKRSVTGLKRCALRLTDITEQLGEPLLIDVERLAALDSGELART